MAIHTIPEPTLNAELELQLNQHGTDANISASRAINEETGLSRKDLLRVFAASISFFFAGSNDGSLGPLTPYILRTYHVGTEYVALM